MKLTSLFVSALLLALGSSAYFSGAASAQTKDELIRSLSSTATRGFAPPKAEAAERNRSLVNSLKGKTTRQITVEERTEIAKIARENELPQIDLEVYFNYDSAVITEAALPTLGNLGQALGDEKLKGAVFMIAGHTDTAGGAAYNQALSERRADAVKSFLVATFKLDPKTLIAIGYGKEQLKLPDDPLSGQNRRVQVVNLAGEVVAAR
jgi:outer membrane protein OmpA-like peptidoglycan-associated protein